MVTSKTFKVVIAEAAPIILRGLAHCLKNIKETNVSVMEVDSRDSLFNTVTTDNIDLLLVNPTFSGLLHPGEIRKISLNPDIKIYAIEISKLNAATLSLYDDHLHVTDDLNIIKDKVIKIIEIEQENTEEKESLSIREKEIISFVVKGFTNQEIADKLYLSVHTVMTHRRNIARKLQIHSATGLTIYAIVNNIVNISDIKL